MTDLKIMNNFSIDDVYKIIDDGFNYELPDETIKLIELLSSKVGAPSYIKTPNFQKKNSNRHNVKKNKYKNLNLTDTDWESIRDFKKTEIKQKEGAVIYIDQVRRLLNKITEENYDNVRDELLSVIENITTDNGNKDTLLSIGNIIFETASQNKFYSKLYAKLYSELKEKIPVINDIFYKSYNEFNKTFEVIEFVEAEEDYNKFCLTNKENDKRKAMSLFITHLISFDMVEVESGIKLLTDLKNKFKNHIEKENCKKIVEEICENLYIIITNGVDYLSNNDDWDSIIDYIKLISEKEANDFPSLTNKVIFKCMDIIEDVF